MPAPRTATSQLRAFQVLAAALMSALVVIAIALSFVLTGGTRSTRSGHRVQTHPPQLWVYLVVLGLGLASALLVQLVGYRIAPVSPSADPAAAARTGVARYQGAMVLRFALIEAVPIITIALSFAIAANTVLPYLVAAAVALVLMYVHVWPSERLIAKVEAILDRQGGRSQLSATLRGTG